jgi:glycine/D-amino acid oxidase-like deaminating enzyme
VRAAHLRLAMQRERGVDARWVSPAQAAELLALLDADRILGATYCAEDGAITLPRNVAAYLVAMRDPGVARAAADLALHGSTAVTDVSFLGADRFEADGRSRLTANPIALPFPEAVLC